MVKTICIAATAEEAKALTSEAKKTKAVAIAYTPVAGEAFKEAGIDALQIELYSKSIDFTKLDFIADKWSKTWYLQIPHEKYNGIYLGELSETDLFSHHGRQHSFESLPYQGTFVDILGGIERVQKTLKAEKPTLVLVSPTWFGTLVRLTCQTNKIPTKLIMCKPDFHFNFPNKTTYTKHVIKYHVSKLFKKVVKPLVPPVIAHSDKENILLANNYPPSFMPLYSELLKNPKNNPVFLAKGFTAIKSLLKLRAPFITFDQYYNRQIEAMVQNRATQLRFAFDNLISNPPTFTHNGVPFFELLQDNIAFLYFMRYPEGVLNIELANKLLQEKKIDVIVTLSDGPHIERALVMVGNQLRCKSLCIQHGIVGDMPSFTRLYCDKMAVFGKNSAKLIEFFGIDRKKLALIGQSKFDRLTKRSYDKNQVCKKLGLNPKKPIVLFASQTVGCGSADNLWQYDLMIRSVLLGCRDKQLVVKIHPAESLEEVTKIANQVNSHAPILKKFDLQELINACDVFINKDSTTGIEAMVMKKPMIVFNPGKKLYFDYSQGGGAVVAHNAEEVQKAVDHLLCDKKFRENTLKKAEIFLSDTLTNYRADSTKATCKIIEELSEA